MQIDLSGGESVYCINEAQLRKAFELAENDPDSSVRIKDYLNRIETDLSRNERAALAFILVDHLLKNE